MNITMAAEEIDTIISNTDYLGNGKINYSEFIAATIESRSVVTREKLWQAFKHFDTDDSGFITAENLIQAFD